MSTTKRTINYRASRTQRTQRLTTAKANNEPCCRCGQPIDYALPYRNPDTGHVNPGYATMDHLDPIVVGGTELTHPDLIAPAHYSCNSRHGAKLRAALKGRPVRFLAGVDNSRAPVAKQKTESTRKSRKVTKHPGYHPDGFVLPRIWPEPNPRADYRMAEAFLAWSDGPDCPGKPLTPWERFWAREVLAMAEGRFLYRMAVLRVSRQQGKTYVVRRVLLFLLLHGEMWLGQPQRIINTHFDGLQAVSLMEPMARALGYGGPRGLKDLQVQNHYGAWYPGGVESDDAALWLSRAMTMGALTGNQGITVAFVDELQDAKRRQVQEALGGSMSGAGIGSRLRLYAGTGKKPGSDLQVSLEPLIGTPGMFWAEWSPPPGSDPGDEAVWAWASPDWSESRLEYLRDERLTMPSDEFQRNYLLLDDAPLPDGLVGRQVWEGLRADLPPVVAVAVEAAPGGSPVVCFAGREGAFVVVSVAQCGSMLEAAEMAGRAGVVPLVGKSLLHDPVWRDVGATPMSGTGAAACGTLLQLVADGVLRHDGGDLLAGQVTGTTAVAGPAGLRITSGGRVDAIKAVVWAVEEARAKVEWFAY